MEDKERERGEVNEGSEGSSERHAYSTAAQLSRPQTTLSSTRRPAQLSMTLPLLNPRVSVRYRYGPAQGVEREIEAGWTRRSNTHLTRSSRPSSGRMESSTDSLSLVMSSYLMMAGCCCC